MAGIPGMKKLARFLDEFNGTSWIPHPPKDVGSSTYSNPFQATVGDVRNNIRADVFNSNPFERKENLDKINATGLPVTAPAQDLLGAMHIIFYQI